MLNPKDVLTDDGVLEFSNHLFNVDKAVFFLTNHSDDLQMAEEDVDLLYAAQDLVNNYRRQLL